MQLIAGEHYYQDADLSQIPSIRHGFFTRNGGVSSGIYASLNAGIGSDDDAAAVNENRQRIAHAMGVDESALYSLFQCHSDVVIPIDASMDANARPKADGMVTRTSGLALGILTADCAPVLLADATAGVIGACHAGWKGALAGIPARTVEAMEALGATRSNITASVGPCIHQKSYEVDAAYREKFLQADPDFERFFARPPAKAGHFQFDLPHFVQTGLRACGVGSAKFLAFDTCFEENAFFSNRRRNLHGEPDYGRQLSVIVLA